MIITNFRNDSSYIVAYGLWQYDYGQKLRIQGLTLPTAVEIHFSLRETGGESVTRVGVTKDGVTDVPIPDSMLENNGTNRDYKIYAFIYLTDDSSGETIRKIIMPVKSRPKPEAFNAPEDAELFREAIAVVNEAADRAEESAKTAQDQIAGFDEHVANKVTEAEAEITKAKDDAVNEVSADIKKATDAANTAVNAAKSAESAKTEAVQAIQTEGDTQIQAVNSAGDAALKAVQTKQDAVIRTAQEQIQNIEGTADEKIAEIEAKGTEVLDSIPEDYVQMWNDVAANREQLKTKSDAIVQTASGTSIVAQDSSNDPVRGLRVFGRTTQDGTPTPDAPVPLVSVGDAGSVEVRVYGSNLLDYERWKKVEIIKGTAVWENNGVTLTATDVNCYTGGYSVSDKISYNIPCNQGETYILTWEHTGDKDDRVYVFFNGIVDNQQYENSNFGKLRFTIPEDCIFFTFRVGCYVAGTTSHYKNVRLNIKDARDFEPYTHQSLTLPTPNGLPGIPVNDESLANYTDADGQMRCSDEIDLERGVYVQRTLLNKLDSSRNWIYSTNTSRFYCKDNRFMCTKVNSDYYTDAFCSHFSKCGHVPSAGFNDLEFGFINDADHGFAFRHDALNGDIDAWKAFLNENDVYVLGVLVSPIETPLTDAELSAYQSLHSNYPVTTVLNDAGAHMEFSYNADPKNYIAAEHAKMEAAFDAKLAEIIALLPAETQAAMIENETTNLLNESEE